MRKKNPSRGSQHWIATVRDTVNNQIPATSYFDGTMTQAKKWFKRDRVIKEYWSRPGYVITMQPNSIILWDGYVSKNPIKKNPDNRSVYVSLMSNYGAEFNKLNATDRKLIVDDFVDALTEENLSVSEYKRRIGPGNLASYARVMRVKDAKRKKNPDNEIRELILFAENNEPLNNQFYSILKNLEKKAKKGTYDPVLAAKLWKYWIDNAVKEYNYEFLTRKRSLVQNVFSVQDRKDAAIQVEAQWRDDVFRGDNPSHRKNPVAGRSKGEPKNIYEIYTKHPTTGEGGWNILFVRSTKGNIKSFPLFDEIITVNDYPMSGDRSGIVNWDGVRVTKNPIRKTGQQKSGPQPKKSGTIRIGNAYDGVGPHVIFLFNDKRLSYIGRQKDGRYFVATKKADAVEMPIDMAQKIARSIRKPKWATDSGVHKASLPMKFARGIQRIATSDPFAKK